MSECKNCGHLIWNHQGVLFHYQTYKNEELREKCWSCSCEKPEEEKK